MAKFSYALNLGLNDVPDDKIDPVVWEEMNKLFLACKLLADAFDSGVNPGLENTPGATVTLQNYSKIRRIASENMEAGSVVQLGQNSVYRTSSTYPIPGAFTENVQTAGVVGEFILCGMVYYAPGGLTNGVRYYVDTANPGRVTSATGGKFVGQAFGTHVLFFDPVQPY